MSEDITTGDFLRKYDINDVESYKRFVFADKMYKRIYKRLQKFIIASRAFTYNYASMLTLKTEEVEKFFNVDVLLEKADEYITDTKCFKKVNFSNCDEDEYIELVAILYKIIDHFKEGKTIENGEERLYTFYVEVLDLEQISIEEDDHDDEDDRDYNTNDTDSDEEQEEEEDEDAESLNSDDSESSMNTEEEEKETKRLSTKVLLKHAKKGKFIYSGSSEEEEDEEEDEHQSSEEDVKKEEEDDDVLEPVLKKNKITVDSKPEELFSEEEEELAD